MKTKKFFRLWYLYLTFQWRKYHKETEIELDDQVLIDDIAKHIEEGGIII